ncbi:LamG-like jellyroll fold domain-containing protein [Kitasatospora sp. NPDC001664]
MSAERPAGSRLKTYGDRTYLHTTMVRHQGTTVALALGEDRRIYYSVLDFDAAVTARRDGEEESRADLDVHHWSEDPKELAFPREIARAGYALLGGDRVPRVRGRAEEGPEDVFRDEELDPFLSSTARLTAAVPFQAVSDGRHVFVFRQAVDAGHADGLVWDEDGDLTGTGTSGTPVADGALLCDRFVLAAGELRPVLEVRYRRSGHRTEPESAKDSLGIKDMDERPFHEPTLELGFAGRPEQGRFSVLLLPTGVTGVSRWQFFVHGKASGAVESVNVEQGEDGLFHTQGSRLWTSPDPTYRQSVLEREPGLCPFTRKPLVPVEPEAKFAEAALSLPGSTGKGYGEAAAPSGLGATAYTVEAWIRRAAAGGTVLSTGASGLTLSVDGQGVLQLAHGSATLSTEAGLVAADAYTHVAAVYDGSSASLLVNGEVKTSGPLTAATAPATDGKLLLGAGTATTGHFAGVLDEVRVWSRARATARIAATRGERLVGDEPKLVAYYRCDEGTGTTAYDQSANGAHAALRGTTAWIASDAPVADHPGIRRDAFRVTGYRVTGGLSAALLHQQEEGTVGGGEIRPLKRQARVLLTWAATASGGTAGRIAALDLAVGRDGRIVQLPDVLTLPVVGSAVPAADPARENELAVAIARDTEAAAAVRAQSEKLRADLRRRRELAEELAKARRICTTAVFAADLAKTPALCEVYAADGRRLVVEKDGKGVYRPVLTGSVPKAGDKSAQWTVDGKTFKNVQTGTCLTDQGIDKAIVLGSTSTLTLRQEGGSPLPRELWKEFGIKDDGMSLYFRAPGKDHCLTWNDGLRNSIRWLDSTNVAKFHLVPVKPAGDRVLKAVAGIDAALARIKAVENFGASQKAYNEEITRLLAAVKSNGEELGRLTAYTKGRSIHTEPMKQLGQDRLGLGYSGAVLDFAAAKGSPFLAESGTGHLGLYYRDDQDRLTGLFYDTNVDRSTRTVTAADRTEVLLTTRDAGVDLADVTVTVAAGSTDGRCTLTLAVKDGDTETWAELPRDAQQFAAALNGVRQAPVSVGATASFKDGVLTLAAAGSTRALDAGSLLAVGGAVYVLSEEVAAGATELRLVYGSRTATIAAGTAVELLSYTPDLVTHTRPGAAAEYGSRYVSASVVSEAGSTIGAVADGAAALTGAVRLPRWWADLPGRALTFAAATKPPALPAAKLDQARQRDDLTIEAWLHPAAGTAAEDTRRIVHANTGTAALDSQYVLALGATTTKTVAGERPLVVGVGNRFVTSKATVPSDRWTHVAAAFEQSWALRFASGVYAQAPHADELNIGRDLTLEVFLQTDALGTAQGVLAKGRTADGRGRRVPYQLGIDAEGQLVFTFEDRDGNEVRRTSTGKVRAGTFHRIAVVRKLGDSREEKKGSKKLSVVGADGKPMDITVDAIESLVVKRWSDLTFYIDGAEAGNIRYEDAPDLGTPGPLDIGRARRGTATEGFTGVISEVRIWNTARQAKDLGDDLPLIPAKAPAEGGVEAQLRPEGLVAHWRFEENEGNAARDESGDHPARLHGPKWTKNPDPKGSRFRLYVDGRLTEASPLAAVAYGDTAQLALGGRRDGSATTDRYLGVLEEVRLWRTARSEEQILDNLFGRLTGDTVDLLGYYPFDDDSTEADAVELRDHGPRRLHLPLGTDQAKRPKPLMSTAPISSETPEVRPVFTTGQPRYVQTIAGTPAASEYADLQRGRDGVSRGVLKRAYAYLQDGSWNLITGYKLGDLATEWVGQVQFAPQLVGYIEGAPPVPSENLIATRRPSSLSYLNTTTVEFQQADQVVQTLTSGGESTVDTELAFRFSNNADASTLLIAAPLGFGTATPMAQFKYGLSAGGSFEFSNGWSSETQVAEGVNTERSTSIGLSGGWETDDPTQQIHAAGGRRFLPANTGYALVQSETADVFALRVAHSGAVVAYRMLPNRDIPRDWNMIPFKINPRYVKQGVLDGMVGYDETPDPASNAPKGKLVDKDYPQAKEYGEYSYFKPREAYALKRRITEAMQRRQAFYEGVSTETAKAGSFPAQERAQKLLDRFTGPVPGNGKEEQTKKREAEGFARRDLVNTYVWTADGGFFAETTSTTDVVTESTSGSYRFHGMAAASFDTSFKAFGVGIGFQLDGALGGGISNTRSKAKEATRSFSLNVKVDTPGDMQKYDEQSNPLFDAAGNAIEVPGRVDAYRFMTFYLDSDKANFEDFYGKVVDPEWLLGPDANAVALRQADQSGHKPPCWRILHRVTFVSRKLPKVVDAAGSPVEKAMRSADVGSNYELLRRLEPYVDRAVADRDELAEQVEAAIDLEVPALGPYAGTITEFFAAYYGVK